MEKERPLPKSIPMIQVKGLFSELYLFLIIIPEDEFEKKKSPSVKIMV